MKLVELELFKDSATGDYGFTHRNTISWNYECFNAFYNAIGLLHDVFEHEHEGERYFQDDAFMNIGGEIAAAGAGIYIAELVGKKRYFNNYRTPEIFINNTKHMIIEGIVNGYFEFGHILECNVPRQRPIKNFYGDSYEIESVIDIHWNQYLKHIHPNEHSEYFEESMQYKKSFTLGKLRNLYRWGYRKAKRRIDGNYELVTSFIDFFNVFTKEISSEELWNLGLHNMDIAWNRNMWRGKLYGPDQSPIHFNMNTNPHNLVRRVSNI